MPSLPYSIELHDSVISAIEERRGDVFVTLADAYIHQDGKGWSRHAVLRISSATLETEQSAFPVWISDGHLLTKLGPSHNFLNISIDTDGPVELELELVSGRTVKIVGHG